jgi:hypothetical protein
MVYYFSNLFRKCFNNLANKIKFLFNRTLTPINLCLSVCLSLYLSISLCVCFSFYLYVHLFLFFFLIVF